MRVFRIAIQIVWAMLFFTLPVTSFPFFPGGFGGKTLVRPLSLYPLLILLLLVTIKRILTRPLPKTWIPLLAFVTIALISSLISLSAGIQPLRGISVSSRFWRNIITLGIGGSYFAVISTLHDNQDDLLFSLRWLYFGFAVALLWGSIQAINVLHNSPEFFKLLSKIQSLISTRKLFSTRISGMTYEPKWFAEQICFVLFPWLLSSILTRQSAFRWHYRRLTIEALLAIWAGAVLIFTYSRTGLVVLILLVMLSFVLYRYEPGLIIPGQKRSIPRWRIGLETGLLLLGLLIGVVWAGSQNPYFSRFWRYFTEAKQRNRTYLEYIAFEQRFVYWETAVKIYETHPFLGVGLGNYAFYFGDLLPDQFYNQPEIIRQATPTQSRDSLITPKNLVGRLLAETGMIGTLSFFSFLLAILGCVILLLLNPMQDMRFWGFGGILGMVALSLLVFSFDSFALPNMWVFTGLVCSAAHLPEALPEKSTSVVSV